MDCPLKTNLAVVILESFAPSVINYKFLIKILENSAYNLILVPLTPISILHFYQSCNPFKNFSDCKLSSLEMEEFNPTAIIVIGLVIILAIVVVVIVFIYL